MRFSDQIHDGLDQRLVVKTSLGQIIIRARIQAAHPIFIAIFVGDDHDGKRFEMLVLLDERIKRISKEVAAELIGQPSQSSDPLIGDIEAANIQKALQRIMVKEFISIREAHLLLCCSDGHIRNLVDKARKKKTSHPIPFLDLDGVTVFQRVKLLEWAEQPKQKLRAAS